MVQRELLGNDTPHRVADDVRGVPTRVVHQRTGVVSHRFDGDSACAGLAAAEAAVIVRQRLEATSQVLNLRAPRTACDADALDEEYGWMPFGTTPFELQDRVSAA